MINYESLIGYDSLGHFAGSLLADCNFGSAPVARVLAAVDSISHCKNIYGSFSGFVEKNSVFAGEAVGLQGERITE